MVLRSASKISTEQLLKAFNERLKVDLDPLFRASEVRVVPLLPRTTASNKVMRRELPARGWGGEAGSIVARSRRPPPTSRRWSHD
jgi:acyl-coenzyme A synthetase/AMP-(fatty) acid ligase